MRGGAILGVACLVAASLPGGSRAAGGGTVVVPHLPSGLVAAYARLHASGLRVSIPRGISYFSFALPRVTRVVPGPGRRIRRGSVVTLSLSPGPSLPPRLPRHPPTYVVTKFRGGAADAAYGWVKTKRLAFTSYLGPLRAGGASGLFANYRVTRQRPDAGAALALDYRTRPPNARAASTRLTPLIIWATQAQPDAQTGPVGAVGLSTVSLAGTIATYGTDTTYSFSYGPTAAYGAQTAAQPASWNTPAVAAHVSLAGLRPATTYHYRIVATNRLGTVYGADRSFTTRGYYQNSIYPTAAFPDPFILDNGGTHSDYWAFATGDLFPVLHSTDLVHWTARGAAMITRPAWVTRAANWHPWAPSVVETNQACPNTSSRRCYIMYYVALSKTQNVNCIGVGTSPAPGGPYLDQGPLARAQPSPGDTSDSADPNAPPIGCQDTTGKGNIDPSPFADPSGQAYLYVSTDRACSAGACTLKPTVSVIPLTPDLQQAVGPRIALFSGDPGTWEASGVQTPTVEGPWMELHNGMYYLFYSGGSWQGAYGMGYATATSPTGPFTKARIDPVLTDSAAVRTPGGADALVTGPHGALWTVYAGRDSTYSAPRMLRLDPFSWRATAGAPDTPVIAGPTTTAQPTQP